jgi:RNA polymerase sigma factor (sigma-70 family)
MELTDKQIKQYENLVYKIAHSLKNTTNLPFEDLVQEGFIAVIEAHDTYREGTSQTLFQYIGWMIRYRMQVVGARNGQLMSGYSNYQRKVNGATCSMVDTDTCANTIKSDLNTDSMLNMEMVFDYIFKRMEEQFSWRDCEIFYKAFGLKNYVMEKSCEIAKQYSTTPANITIIKNKIIKFLKSNEDTLNLLEDLR